MTSPSRNKALQVTAFLTGIAVALLFVVQAAFAVHDLNLELDGNQAPDAASAPVFDWTDFFSAAGAPSPALPDASRPGFTASVFSKDFVRNANGSYNTSDATTYATGSKDTLPITPGWQCNRDNNVNDKIDLVNAYAVTYVNPADGHEIFYFALERFSNDGDANVAFWFLQDDVSCVSPGGSTPFTGDHVDGDLLIVSAFTKGGVVSTVNVYRWNGGAAGSLGTTPVAVGVDCKVTLAGDPVCATVNDPTNGTLDPPWDTANKSGTSTNLVSEFFEGGLDLTALGLGGRCFSTFMADTRSSQSLTATLFDFALGQFTLCDLEVDKTGDTLSKVGDPVNYTITVTNTGGITLYKQSIIDTLLGNLTANAGCGASLAPGASCTINVSRTVLAGDPDPLPNTVTVIYDSNAGLTGDEVTRTDSHSVNLFQPSVTVDKTGDTLSKAGDPVNYTITVTNTSSSDSPNLVNGTITDTLLGNLLDAANPFVTSSTCAATLPTTAGVDSCTITATRTVLAGDADPLVNTVTVHYNPAGFPNDISASDGHSVNLFQPSVTVDKTGDTLSKAGDDVTYTFTITNTSSADSPNLNLVSITDTLLGDLTGAASPASCDSLAPAASCTFNVVRTVLAGDADPLVNTVTVHYNPAGFPNDISASDGHSVNLFQPSVTVDKTGDTLSKAGDDVTYTFTITNTSSADSPNLNLVSITDTLLGDLTGAASPASCDSLAPAASCTFNVVRTVLAGDADPLVNTVTVHYNPAGFPNDISASDGHSVDLVHPGLTATKTCTPTTAQPGATITYTCGITNTGDVTLIKVSITDSLVGDLTDGTNPAVTSNTCGGAGAALAAGASCAITYTFIAPSGTATLINTVTATYQVQGLPNQLTASSSCTVTIPNEGCTPGFWKNHTSLWDQLSDPIVQSIRATVNGLGAPYVYDDSAGGLTTQLFRNIFGVTSAEMTAAGLDPNMTMEQAINLGGGDFEKLARHGVAALISSASGINYPFNQNQVLTMVHNAIVNLGAEPTAQQLADANNLGCPLS